MTFDPIVRSKYGVTETFPLEDGAAYHASINRELTYALEDREVVKITRLRLISGPGYPMWDVSYCHGALKDGTLVSVQLDVGQFSKRNLKGELIELAKRANRYAKGLGLLDNISKCQ